MTIKAIETRYKGYRFRSRLEARWAVFFDAMGMKWEYEPEGFDLGDAGWYLPDFRVRTPQGNFCWYEIKPKGVLTDTKLSAFSNAIQGENYENFKADKDCDHGGIHQSARLLSGDPIEMELLKSNMCPSCGEIGRLQGHFSQPHKSYVGFAPDPNIWWDCTSCDRNTLTGAAEEERVVFGVLGSKIWPHKGAMIASRTDVLMFARHVSLASEKARSARFEHGDVPA